MAYAADPMRMPVKAAPITLDRATVVWARAFGGERSQDADGPDFKATHVFEGGALGADWVANGTFRVGLFAGGGSGRLSVDDNSQTVDSTYGFGGTYGHFDWDTRFLDIKLWGGGMQNASTRQVMNNLAPSGMESATASYNGTFFTPEVAYGWHLPIGDGVTLTPAARARYVAGWFDGYTEAGSAQGLTVGTRTVQDVEERLELSLSKADPTPWGQPLEAHATFGVLGIERISGDSVAGTLIGVPFSFATPGQNAVAGGYVGSGFDLRISTMTSIFASFEGTIYSDKSRTGTARGGLRARF
jgi:outer membrane autotransporter protein